MTFPAKAGDVFLLCSDGLTTMVSDEEIRRHPERGPRPCAPPSTSWSTPPTAAAGATTSRRSPSASPRRGRSAEEGATLISRTAEQARASPASACAQPTDRLRGQGPMPLTPSAAAGCGRPDRWRDRGRPRRRCSSLARQVYFLGTDDAGRVALYRGLPYELPLGIEPLLGAVLDRRPGRRRSRPERQEVVTEHKLRGKDDATRLRHRHRAEGGLAAADARRPRQRRRASSSDRSSRPAAAAGRAQQSAQKLERAHPRAPRPDPGRPPGHGRLHRGPDHRVRTSSATSASSTAPTSSALCVATHIVIRIRLPDADPFLFPLVALLAAFGVVMLFRLDEGLARDQANWFVLGLVAVLGDDHLPARLRGARALPLPDRARRDRPAAAAALPRHRRDHQRRLPRRRPRPDHLPADRAGQDLHRRLPRQLPERAPRGARGGGADGSPASCCRR